MDRCSSPLRGVLFLAGLLCLPLSAQETTNPLSGCFRVVLQVPGAPISDDDEAPEPFVVEFVFEPSHAWEAGYERTWRLNESTQAESVAFWWIEDDGLVAIWPVDDDILTLQLVPSGGGLVGFATPTLDPAADRRRVSALPMRCPTKIETE